MKKRDLTFKPELESIINKCTICNLSMVDQEGKPYVLPMNFGYKDDHIYFHSARTGKKIDILQNNPESCRRLQFFVDCCGLLAAKRS